MIEIAKALDSASAGSAQEHRSEPAPAPARFPVLGVGVSAVQIPQVIEILERWILERSGSHYVAVTGMHGITEAQYDRQFRSILQSADLVVPDGMPLVWIGRWRGFRLRRRVYGPELMATFFQETGDRYRHFFYGGAPGVADRLSQVARQRYGIRVVGTYCPPFRPLTEEEDRQAMQAIAESRADVLWVGLSTPKQERWMSEHLRKVSVPVMLGVGAAFDLNAGTLRQAPRWMREHGLEWLFRLAAEPRRLWRRYVIFGSKFAWNVSLELLGLKAFD
ncbi:MAG: WecB/TagA/CpsF family glycosyltransferase [Terriglobales bacterium]|jgi:N-acetylglucosaminyldiphosphoundecaprenol N-acetyl-beta-D-mannosaminyltransferase